MLSNVSTPVAISTSPESYSRTSSDPSVRVESTFGTLSRYLRIALSFAGIAPALTMTASGDHGVAFDALAYGRSKDPLRTTSRVVGLTPTCPLGRSSQRLLAGLSRSIRMPVRPDAPRGHGSPATIFQNRPRIGAIRRETRHHKPYCNPLIGSRAQPLLLAKEPQSRVSIRQQPHRAPNAPAMSSGSSSKSAAMRIWPCHTPRTDASDLGSPTIGTRRTTGLPLR